MLVKTTSEYIKQFFLHKIISERKMNLYQNKQKVYRNVLFNQIIPS